MAFNAIRHNKIYEWWMFGLEEKEIEFEVKMNSSVLFDYLINHAYSGASGILGTCMGTVGILLFVKMGMQAILYLIFGIIIILYLPITLWLKSKQLMVLNESFKSPLAYTVNADGITVSQGDEKQSIEWDKCIKAVSTKQSIVLYTGKNNASVFPRKQLGEQLPVLISVISAYMDPKKVKIRF